MNIECAPNFRDMGGKPTSGGGRVRERQLFRAEAIRDPGEADAARLAALGIRLVCDLRSNRERATAPSYWLNTQAEVVALDVTADFRANFDLIESLRVNPGEAGAIALMTNTYKALPAAGAQHLGVLFRRLGEGDHPVVIHCTAGKDRTGFFSAMILTALGVHADDVLDDYLETLNRRNVAVIAATRALMEDHLGGALSDEALAALAGARAEYLAASFEVITREYGSVEAYLEGPVGLDAAARARLVERLVI